jgi:hypothetical protein
MTAKAKGSVEMKSIRIPVVVAIAVALAVLGGRAVTAQDKFLGNPAMIGAYRAGIPANGKPFPDGAKMAKIQWRPKKSAEAPVPTKVHDTLKDVAFMAKDGKRFPDSGGWGYAMFNYDPPSDRFTPEGTGATCGAACHTIVKAKDYVFTAYGKK